uniref:Uncharacterized protein n=1 Tax=Brugia timori TaxID=42155 RepID=A0A0R3QCU8_9BILA
LDDIRNGENEDNRDGNKQRHTMIDKMLRNREAELQKYADLQRKLHAAEKIEICRRIRVHHFIFTLSFFKKLLQKKINLKFVVFRV